MQFRTLLITLLLFSFLESFAQISPYKRYQGLLWEISGKGTARPSYLYGTMHVPEKLVFNLSDSFFVALRASDYVSLETNHDVWQDFMQKMKEDNETYGYSGGNQFGGGPGSQYDYSDLYGQAFKFEAPDIRLFEAMFAYKPVMANEFLYRSNGYGEDFEENTYLDLFIFQAGKKLGKKVIGLETMDGSYESVTRANIPDDDTNDEYNPYSRKYVSPNGIRDAYRKQDLNTLDSLNDIMSPGKNFKKWMLEERNIVMADGIDSIAQMGKSMFSAVGAAHLAGSIGVIEQLRKRGYTMRPVQFSFDTDKKNMADIEKIKYPVNFSTQWGTDSVWSADAPGKFYSTSEVWRIEQSLCADMSNGAYYSVYRLKTNGLWAGQSPEYISSRIDSIIYEKIPGKIQERKRISEPFPGHDITTRTRRGDIQRYKLYITPAEVIVFIMGANGDYVSGDEGNRFFNSIRFNVPKIIAASTPTTIAPSPGNFNVVFPVKPFINTTLDKKAKDLYIAGQEKNPDNGYYFLTRVNYPDVSYIEEDTFELNIICEKLAEQYTKKKPSLTMVSNAPYPTQEVQFRSDKDSAYYFARIVIDGPAYYLIGCRNRTGEKPEAFFNSFGVVNAQWPDGWMEKVDTTGKYKLMVPKEEIHQPSQLYVNLKKIGEEIAAKSRKKYDPDDQYSDYQTRNYSDQITSKKTGEVVNVYAFTSYTSDYTDKDSLKRSTDRYISSNKSLIIKSSTLTQKGDSLLILDYQTMDTNSNRGILTKIWLTSKRRYTLTANINMDNPPSAFIAKVFDSFTPTDTSLRQPIRFGTRDIAFLDHIYAEDSTERKQAIKSMREYNWTSYKKEDYGQFVAIINHPKFDKLKFQDKEYLLAAISACKAPAALDFYKNFYQSHSDSVRYQSVVLKNIPRLRTKEAFQTMFDMLLAKPQFMDYSHISAVYYNMEDTLKLTSRFVPELLQLAQRDEHYNKVLSILSKLVEKGLIKPKAYKSLKSKLLSDQQYALSEERFGEETSRDKTNADYRYAGYRNNQNGYYNEEGGTEDPGNMRLKLLMPYYQTDASVKALMDEMLRKGSKNTQLDIIRLFAKNKVSLPTSILEPLAQKDDTRFNLYSALVSGNINNNYANWFSDTTAMVQSYIVSSLDLDNIDSVKFISKYKSVVDKKPAVIYFFDVKMKKSTDWMLQYVTLPLDYGLKPAKTDHDSNETDSPELSIDYYPSAYPSYGNVRRYAVQSEANLNEKDKQEFIAKKVGEIRFAGRLRYRSARNQYYNEY